MQQQPPCENFSTKAESRSLTPQAHQQQHMFFSEARMRDARLLSHRPPWLPPQTVKASSPHAGGHFFARQCLKSLPLPSPHGWEKQILSKASLALVLLSFLGFFFSELTSSPPSDSLGQMQTLLAVDLLRESHHGLLAALTAPFIRPPADGNKEAVERGDV